MPHPDVSENAQRSIFVTRVTTAWNDLKTPEKRTAYDVARASGASSMRRWGTPFTSPL